MKIKSHKAFLITCIVSVGISVISLRAVAEQKTVIDSAKAPLSVQTITAKKRLLSEFEFSQGTSYAHKRAYLVFQSSGKVAYIGSNSEGLTLREGDKIYGPSDKEPQGQLLAELTRTQGDAQIASALAAVETAKTAISSSRREYNRGIKLQKSGAIARSKFDSMKAAYSKDLISLKEAESRVQSAQAGIEHLQLRAPFDGLIAFNNIRKGHFFSSSQFDASSDKSATRTAPMVVIDPSSFEIIVDLPVFNASQVRKNQRAFLVQQEVLAALQIGSNKKAFQSIRNHLIPATVISVSPAVNPQDRSIRIRLLTDENSSDKNLLDGGFVTVWLETLSKPDALVLPMQAIIFKGNEAYAFVRNEQGIVEKRDLEIGLFGIDGVEIIQGIKAGEQVVTKGNNRLKTGQSVALLGEGAFDTQSKSTPSE